MTLYIFECQNGNGRWYGPEIECSSQAEADQIAKRLGATNYGPILEVIEWADRVEVVM